MLAGRPDCIWPAGVNLVPILCLYFYIIFHPHKFVLFCWWFRLKVCEQCPTLAHVCTSGGLFGSAEAQLPTNYAGSIQVPQVITHRPPFPLFQHLYTSLSKPGSCFQTYCLLKQAEKGIVRKWFKRFSENWLKKEIGGKYKLLKNIYITFIKNNTIFCYWYLDIHNYGTFLV